MTLSEVEKNFSQKSFGLKLHSWEKSRCCPIDVALAPPFIPRKKPACNLNNLYKSKSRIRSQKGLTKPINRTNSTKEFSEQFEANRSTKFILMSRGKNCRETICVAERGKILSLVEERQFERHFRRQFGGSPLQRSKLENLEMTFLGSKSAFLGGPSWNH